MTRMKLWIICAFGLPVALLAQTNRLEDESLFRAHEMSLDLFGTVSVGQETIEHPSGDRVREDGELGAGIGLNYFLTRNLGLGVDAYSENTSGVFVDNASANLIVRFPIDAIHLAPYAYGGGGYQFDPGEVWFGQFGAGLEVRFTTHVGVFADARYVMTDGTENFGVGRLGLRFAF